MADRVALVTGGSRGIGRAISVALSRSGPVAVNFKTHADEAKEALSLIEQAGGEGIVVEADVTSPTSVDEMFKHVEEALGPVSVLVNNAGVRIDALAVRMSDEAWNNVVQTSMFGSFSCSRRALRSMIRARWGRIVNIASVAAIRGNAGQTNYGAAKAGLIGFTRAVAREVARKNITVNAVAPGLIDTDLTATLSAERTEEIVSEIPMGRAGTPEEIAQLVAFLCSDQANYITGSVVVADGGLTA